LVLKNAVVISAQDIEENKLKQCLVKNAWHGQSKLLINITMDLIKNQKVVCLEKAIISVEILMVTLKPFGAIQLMLKLDGNIANQFKIS